MTSLTPRAPYTDEELKKLYPRGLELQLVQVLLRHGERTPVSARFQNAGLAPFWPYCSTVRQLKSTVLDGGSGEGVGNSPRLNTLEWKRRLETFGRRDEPVPAVGPANELDGICDMGALTDTGRVSTYQLGARLRSLYVDRLRFLPHTVASTDFLYLRSTPVPRALESLQQTLSALYPPSARRPGPDGVFPPPTIVSRPIGDETLFPNDGNCRRFAALSRAFAQRAADRWNGSDEMAYLNKVYGRWMPPDSPTVAVDSRPRLSGVMDTVNATLAHGPETRLPREFYDAKARHIMQEIAVDEWFRGYKESREYRALGIGALMGDIVARMVDSADGGNAGADARIKLGLSGCHDTTLAGILASLGAYETGAWPPFTSHIAVEMFRKPAAPPPSPHDPARQDVPASAPRSRWAGFFSPSSNSARDKIGRRSAEELAPDELSKLEGYYVRLRYNDEPVTIPGCRLPGNHLEGDESFCTLSAFKAIVDKFTPKNWKQECRVSTNAPITPTEQPEPAGY